MPLDQRYGPSDRLEVWDFLPDAPFSLLDVGCNDGSFGSAIRGHNPENRVVGIETNAQMAEVARSRLNQVVCGEFPDALGSLDEVFDVVTFNHVLEHLVDPWQALSAIRGVLSENSRVIAIIPNIRYFPFLWGVTVGGDWEYVDTGLLDKTHLRFFTPTSARRLFRDAGFEVTSSRLVNRVGQVRYPRLSRAAGHLAGELAFGAVAISAVPRSIRS